MNNNNYTYKNFELVLKEPCDYYVFINYPNKVAHNPSKSIIFQMEPYVYDETKKWGVKTWGKWKDPKGYLHVRKHINSLNPAQWYFTPSDKIYNPRFNKMIIILSSKTNDVGHMKRINFVKYIEQLHLDIIDVYGYQNYHNLKSYVGPLPNDDKSIFQRYKYVLSAENNNEYNYATEKIWEPIISYCLCFYDGCPNLSYYIDSNAFVALNLSELDKSLQIILKYINENKWDNRLPIISTEKQKILEKYNFFECVYKSIL